MAITNREIWNFPLAMPQGLEAQRRRVDPQVRQALRFFALLVAISLAFWLDVLQTSHITTTRYQIDQLRAEKAVLDRQNARLLQQISETTSLPSVQSRAKELGFVAVGDKPLYVSLDKAPALAVNSAAGQPPASAARPPVPRNHVTGANPAEIATTGIEAWRNLLQGNSP